MGPVRKLMDQQHAAIAGGLDLQVRVLTDGPTGGWGSLGVQIKWFPGVSKRLQVAIARHALIQRSLEMDGYDAIILRHQGAMDCTAPAFLSRWGRRVITEHHSIESAEFRALGRLGWIKGMAEDALVPAYLTRCMGSIGVTREIVKHHSILCQGREGVVISNGIATDRVAWQCPPQFADRLEVAFCAAGFWPWQGLDRVEAGLAAYRGKIPLVVHVIGTLPDRRGECLPVLGPGATAIYHGHLNGADLEAVMGRCHLGLGTLALHRKGMLEACPLKSRDYAARGLPFAFAHQDPDFRQEAGPWLHLPADDSPLEVGRLVDFAAGLVQDGWREASVRLREHAVRELDWQYKMLAMARYARSCLSGRVLPARPALKAMPGAADTQESP